jgi:hypothetical protein
MVPSIQARAVDPIVNGQLTQSEPLRAGSSSIWLPYSRQVLDVHVDGLGHVHERRVDAELGVGRGLAREAEALGDLRVAGLTGTAADVEGIMVYLASDESACATGGCSRSTAA